MPLDLSYTSVLTLHISAMFFSISLVVFADVLGLLWFFNRIQTLPEKVLKWTHRCILFGIFVSIITGILMFNSVSTLLLRNPAFYIKISFILFLLINAYFIHKHYTLSTTNNSMSLTCNEKNKLILFGTISALSWISVLIASQFLGL